jgi:hypothetical protein
MKFKVLKGTALYDQLAAIQKKANDCSKAAIKFAKSLGADAVFTHGRINAAGGIDAFRFEWGKDPDKLLWMQPDRHKTPRAFYPRSGKKYGANKELHEKIRALPVVTIEELNTIIGFKGHIGVEGAGIVHYRTYGLDLFPNYAVISIPDGCGYKKSNKDMIEITTSEFNKLKDPPKTKKEKIS